MIYILANASARKPQSHEEESIPELLAPIGLDSNFCLVRFQQLLRGNFDADFPG
jgi:hypothetical protein